MTVGLDSVLLDYAPCTIDSNSKLSPDLTNNQSTDKHDPKFNILRLKLFAIELTDKNP